MEAIGSNPATIKGVCLDDAIRETEGIIAVLETKDPVEDITVPRDANQKRVFISHGGVTPARHKLESFIRDLGLIPVIAENEPTEGRDIDSDAEEKLTGCACVIILATGDDQTKDGEKQPRGNVISEMRLAEQRLPGRVIYLLEDGASLPSLHQSRAWVYCFTQDNMERAFAKVVRELRAFEIIGYPRVYAARMKFLYTLIVPSLVLALSGCETLPLQGLPPSGPPIQWTANVFHGCPPEGDADETTQADPALNVLKNRIDVPDRFEESTVEEIVNLDIPAGVSKRHRDQWPEEDSAVVEELEQHAVTVEGYLVGVKQEGPEGCNCHIETDRDFHLWLAASPDADRAEAVVIEVSPRIQVQYPNWHLRIFQRLVEDQVPVRVSGWLMLDPEHPDQVGYTRATLWEIHPILKIEVQGVDGWREL